MREREQREYKSEYDKEPRNGGDGCSSRERKWSVLLLTNAGSSREASMPGQRIKCCPGNASQARAIVISQRVVAAAGYKAKMKLASVGLGGRQKGVGEGEKERERERIQGSHSRDD